MPQILNHANLCKGFRGRWVCSAALERLLQHNTCLFTKCAWQKGGKTYESLDNICLASSEASQITHTRHIEWEAHTSASLKYTLLCQYSLPLKNMNILLRGKKLVQKVAEQGHLWVVQNNAQNQIQSTTHCQCHLLVDFSQTLSNKANNLFNKKVSSSHLFFLWTNALFLYDPRETLD